MFFKRFLLTICLIYSAESANLPRYIKPCRTSDPDWTSCAKKHAAEAIPNILKGDKKYGIPPLSPLLIDAISIEPNPGFRVKLSNVTVAGLETAQLLDAKIDEKELQFLIALEHIDLKGTYNVDGRILQIPITGSGPLSLRTTNSRFRVVYPWKYVTRNGEDYLDIREAYPILTHEDVAVRLENLFGGDRELGDRTNRLINENWRVLNDEINPAVVRVIRTLCSRIVGGITERVPAKNIFPK